MQGRDIFDVLLAAMVALVLSFELSGLGSSGGGDDATLQEVVDALQTVDTVYYLVIAGVFGVVFVSYITIYLPHKHSQNP